MSWRDDFDDASLDTAKFGTSVAGDGAVAESGGTVNITMGSNVVNGAIVYIKDALVTTNTFSYTLRHKIDGTLSGNLGLLSLYDGTPAVGAAGTVNANVKLAVAFSAGNGFYVAYKDSAGTWQYWTGTTWSTSPTYFSCNGAYWFDVSIIVKNGKFRISITSQGGTKSYVETLYLAFTSLQAYTTLRIFWGDLYNDYYYCTSAKTEYCIFSNETPIAAYYNGCSSTGNDYKVGRAISLDGGYAYFRNPIATLYLIGPLTGESNVKDPWVFLKDGTYYLFYSCLRNADPYNGKWRIRYATSSDQETWTDQGYITTPGGVGAWDEKGHRSYPVITYHDGQWRMYVGGQSGSDIITVGYFYGSALDSLTNYASNPVVNVGAGGAWNDGGLTVCGITATGSTITLHIMGLKSTSKWQGGVWTSTNWTTWTPGGGNPIIARDVSKQTTANTTSAGDITLTVADSTIFQNDDPIIIGNASVAQTNRVLSKPDATHITLYYPTIAATTPTVSAYNWGSVGIEGLDLSNFPNDALGVTFQTQAWLLETTAWWHYSAGWAYDSSKTPPLPLGVGWDGVSSENLKWIHNGITLALTKSLSDSFSLTDSVSNGIGLNKADAITLSDAIAKGVGKFPSDMVTLSDLFSKIWTISLSLSDGFTLSEAIGKTPGLTKSDAIILSDLFSKIWTANLSLSDVINLIDAISKTPILAKSDALTLTDFLSYLKTIGLNLSDTISLSDTITKILTHFEDFSYRMLRPGVISHGQEGSFDYEQLKSTIEQNLSGWFVTPLFDDWFGGEEIFQFEHQKLMESAPAEESSFEFENLKPTISPVTLNNDFKYKRF